MKAQIVKVVLNPAREDDRRILDYLFYTGKPMSRVFKAAMLRYIDGTAAFDEEKLLQSIRAVLREELQGVTAVSSLAIPSQEQEEERVSPLDFLDQLDAMADF